MSLKFIGIIPARYGSTRFEGKPLAEILGKPMIQRVYEQASKALDTVYVATDDQRIYDAVKEFGGKVVMTRSDHTTGTNRCLEASEKIAASGVEHNVVINVQGDEPLLNPTHLSALMQLFDQEKVELGTLIRPLPTGTVLAHRSDVYVTTSKTGKALYFSRSIIPFVRDKSIGEWSNAHVFYKHIGVYAYTRKALHDFAHLEQSSLELAESLEQNRWLENDRSIYTAVVSEEGLSVDTPEDLKQVIETLQKNGEPE